MLYIFLKGFPYEVYEDKNLLFPRDNMSRHYALTTFVHIENV